MRGEEGLVGRGEEEEREEGGSEIVELGVKGVEMKEGESEGFTKSF